MKNGTDIYLICGATGAGKSTYAEALAQEVFGVRFSIDEWMQRLYNKDKPEVEPFEWLYERVLRSCEQMRAVSERLVMLDTPAIFDCGLTRKLERDLFAQWASEKGFSVSLRFVDTPSETRWQRVQNRNTEQGDSFQFEVTREMFDFIETMWEAPGPKEMAALNGLRVPCS